MDGWTKWTYGLDGHDGPHGLVSLLALHFFESNSVTVRSIDLNPEISPFPLGPSCPSSPLVRLVHYFKVLKFLVSLAFIPSFF